MIKLKHKIEIMRCIHTYYIIVCILKKMICSSKLININIADCLNILKYFRYGEYFLSGKTFADRKESSEFEM